MVHDENTAFHGGALTISGGTTLLLGATFSGNQVQQNQSIGGAIYVNLTNANNAVVEISGSTFTGNYSAKRGGALNLRGNDTTSVKISDTVFDGNSNGNEEWAAGAIYQRTGTLTLTGELKFLTATDCIYAASGSVVNIDTADILLKSGLSASKLNLANSKITFDGSDAFWVYDLEISGKNRAGRP